MFELRARVMGVFSGWKYHVQNQKIYCTQISAIRLRHVGLHAIRTDWKMETLFDAGTMETLKRSSVNQHF